MSIENQLAVEQINELAEIRWWTRAQFKDGSKVPYPERVTLRELIDGEQEQEMPDMDAVIAAGVSDPRVRNMLEGG